MATHDPQSWSENDGPTPRPQAATSDSEALLRDLAERLAAATGSERVAMAVADSLAHALDAAFVHVSVRRPVEMTGSEADELPQPLVGSHGTRPEHVTAELRQPVYGLSDTPIGDIYVANKLNGEFTPADRANLTDSGQLVGTLLAFAAAEPDLSSQAQGAFLALAAALDAHDEFVEGRAARVAAMCELLADELDLGVDRRIVLRGAAAVYDCGTLVTPDLVLHKPGPLSAAEILAIQQHVQRTLEILRRIDLPPELDDVRVIAAQHHERFDGSGYPLGLRGGAIIREARILAVADVLDAMMSERPYRPPFPAAEALAHVRQGSGILFDPTVARAAEHSWDELLRGWEEGS